MSEAEGVGRGLGCWLESQLQLMSDSCPADNRPSDKSQSLLHACLDEQTTRSLTHSRPVVDVYI